MGVPGWNGNFFLQVGWRTGSIWPGTWHWFHHIFHINLLGWASDMDLHHWKKWLGTLGLTPNSYPKIVRFAQVSTIIRIQIFFCVSPWHVEKQGGLGRADLLALVDSCSNYDNYPRSPNKNLTIGRESEVIMLVFVPGPAVSKLPGGCKLPQVKQALDLCESLGSDAVL